MISPPISRNIRRTSAPSSPRTLPELIKDALPTAIMLGSRILLTTALACWLVDVLLGWIFSTLAAPAYAKITRALIYATGRLILAVVLTFVLGVAAMLGLNAGAGWPALLVVIVLAVPALAIQIFWVSWLYRTTARDSGLFYVGLLLVHTVAGCVLIALVFATQIDRSVAQFVDRSIVPRLQVAALAAQGDAAPLAAQRDTARAQVAALQSRLAQDKAEEARLQQAIANGRNLPAFAFSRLVLLRAQGHLSEAATGLAAFIQAHPNDPDANAARGQLEQAQPGSFRPARRPAAGTRRCGPRRGSRAGPATRPRHRGPGHPVRDARRAAGQDPGAGLLAFR